MWNVILDALLDSVKVLPFLLAIYILIELLETSEKARHGTIKLLNGKAAPVIAGAVGVIPQCGFSVMAADLYSQNFIKTGTLIAVFVATSDEALPILLTDPETVGISWIVVAVKIVLAIALGYLVNLFDKRNLADNFDDKTSKEGCCHHEMHGKRSFGEFIKHPLIHTAKIFLYIILVNIIFGLLIFYAEQPIYEFMARLKFAQPFVAALIGLIPNCAGSVVLTGLYSEGIITLGALIAGLVANCGIGLAVLYRNKTFIKRALLITAVLYVTGVVTGVVMSLFV